MNIIDDNFDNVNNNNNNGLNLPNSNSNVPQNQNQNRNQNNLLGRGSYGEVYSINDDIVNKLQVVLKNNFFPGNILVENDILKNCDHPNIVKYHTTQVDHNINKSEISVNTRMEKCDISMYDWLSQYHSKNRLDLNQIRLKLLLMPQNQMKSHTHPQTEGHDQVQVQGQIFSNDFSNKSSRNVTSNENNEKIITEKENKGENVNRAQHQHQNRHQHQYHSKTSFISKSHLFQLSQSQLRERALRQTQSKPQSTSFSKSISSSEINDEEIENSNQRFGENDDADHNNRDGDRNSNNNTDSNDLIKYFYQTLCGLSYLHKHHIIHGDLKLNNIMLKLMNRPRYLQSPPQSILESNPEILPHKDFDILSSPSPIVKQNNIISTFAHKSNEHYSQINESKMEEEKERENDSDLNNQQNKYTYTAKIIDFGMAQYIFDDQVRKKYIQTSIYCAPEVILNHRYYDERVDMWSFGVLFFEAIFDCRISMNVGNPNIQGFNKILQDYLNIFGVPPMTEEWKKILMSALNFYKLDQANLGVEDNDREECNSSYTLQLLSNLLNTKTNTNSNNFDFVNNFDFEKWIKNIFPYQYQIAQTNHSAQRLKLIIDFISKCLKIDPSTRIQSHDAKLHPLFEHLNVEDKKLQLQSSSNIGIGISDNISNSFSIYSSVDLNQEDKSHEENNQNREGQDTLVKNSLLDLLKFYCKIFQANKNIKDLCIDVLEQLHSRSKTTNLLSNLVSVYKKSLVGTSIYLLVVAFNQNTNQEEDNEILNKIFRRMHNQNDLTIWIQNIQIELIQVLNWNFMSSSFRKNLIPLINYI